MSNRVQIAPSILAADFVRLADEIAAVERGGADLLHIDVMDGHFVPNLTIGPPVVESIKKVAKLPLDVHLMITNADAFIPEFVAAGADYVTVHVEACPHLHRTIQLIKERGAKAGVTLNPATPVSLLQEILPEVDLVLIMSVNPGFGGQKYLPASTAKIQRVRELLDRHGSKAALQVDGGITVDTIGAAWQAGADTFVAGTAVFGEPDPAEAVRRLRQACTVRV